MTSEEYKVALAEALRKLVGIMPVGAEWCRAIGKGAPKGGIAYLGQSVTRAMYSDLWDYVQTELADSLIEESEWQTLFTSQNGNVPYYSKGDGSTTFRMPCISGYIKGATTLAEVGSYTKEGLPEIAGAIGNFDVWGFGNAAVRHAEGAFYLSGGQNSLGRSVTIQSQSTSPDYRVASFNASRFNPIYGNSTHVTPETVTVLFGVYAIGTVVSIGEATEEGILADLGNINNQLTNLNTTYVRTIDHHEAVDNNVTVLDTYNVINPVIPGTDTVEDWQALGSGTYWFTTNNTNTGYPESQYGFIINIRGDNHNDVFQIWKPQRDQKPYYRGGNAKGWSSWNIFGGKASLVATYSSGKSWYRKYSDGWIEQGGYYNIPTSSTGDQDFTVTLITPFSTTNYNVLWGGSYSYYGDRTNWILPRASTTTAFLLDTLDTGAGGYSWYACGK